MSELHEHLQQLAYIVVHKQLLQFRHQLFQHAKVLKLGENPNNSYEIKSIEVLDAVDLSLAQHLEQLQVVRRQRIHRVQSLYYIRRVKRDHAVLDRFR